MSSRRLCDAVVLPLRRATPFGGHGGRFIARAPVQVISSKRWQLVANCGIERQEILQKQLRRGHRFRFCHRYSISLQLVIECPVQTGNTNGCNHAGSRADLMGSVPLARLAVFHRLRETLGEGRRFWPSAHIYPSFLRCCPCRREFSSAERTGYVLGLFPGIAFQAGVRATVPDLRHNRFI